MNHACLLNEGTFYCDVMSQCELTTQELHDLHISQCELTTQELHDLHVSNFKLLFSGITYDRKDIEEHLHRVGHFDPVTR